MQYVTIGTAGHVDHGKTCLVKALTGVDTDRLLEEKQRGLTVDLGFAPVDLGQEIRGGIIDVPGHEHFIKNMLAGVWGMEIILFVVAADYSSDSRAFADPVTSGDQKRIDRPYQM